MNKRFFILLFLVSLAAYGQQTSVAVLPSDGDEKVFNNDDLEALTNKMRNVALRTLPSETFALLTQEVVINVFKRYQVWFLFKQKPFLLLLQVA